MSLLCGSCPGCAVARDSFGVDVRGAYVAALLGNPNTGKSTLFNALTGLRQHTGNWPGKTVARREGLYRAADGTPVTLVDLPGAYSLNAQSRDEEAAAEFLMAGACDVAVAVVDATALERNLFLVLQAMEFPPRLVVALNLMDEAVRRGIRIDAPALAEELGAPVAPIVARTGSGVSELIAAVHAAATGEADQSPRPVRLAGEVAEAVGEIEADLRRERPETPNPAWAAKRLFAGAPAGAS
ncbi:MAG: FeoB small GTPase domain-containing protein [bacterium]